VQRVAERDFRFHCLCGATIIPSGKAGTCPSCGKTVEIRRSRKHTHRWHLPSPQRTQSLWQLRDLRKLAIYAVLCILLLCYLYDLACG
jgi:predicted RNA-binding Zn-ribbon protein involved in translation (DUF1610 family)